MLRHQGAPGYTAELNLHRRITWPLRFAVPGVLLLVASLHGLRGRGHGAAEAAIPVAAPPPAGPIRSRGDADRDGLPDALEATLAARYAPRGHPGSRGAKPPGLDRLAARPRRAPRRSPPRAGSFSDEVRGRQPRIRATGSPTSTSIPRVDGGINVQYWFFYPYNDGPLFFDHDGDWEHVTVEVAPDGRPRAVYFAQHGNNSPGVRRAWADVRKLGDHPIVLSARGTHASYPDQASLAWFERASACTRVEPLPRSDLADLGGGRALNMGERGAVLGAREALAYGGRWGGEGRFLRSRPAPRGPLQQGGFGAAGSTDPSEPSAGVLPRVFEKQNGPGEQQEIAAEHEQTGPGVERFEEPVADRIDDLREKQERQEQDQAGAPPVGQAEHQAERQEPDQELRAAHLAEGDEQR